MWHLHNNVFNILHWHILHDYLHYQNNVVIEELYNLEHYNICSSYNKVQANIFKEIYVSGLKSTDTLYLKNISISSNIVQCYFGITTSDGTSISLPYLCTFNTTSVTRTLAGDYEIYGIVNENEDCAYSGSKIIAINSLVASNIKYNSNIQAYILNTVIPKIYNGLDSDDTTKALSASQGKSLNTKITAINTSLSAYGFVIGGVVTTTDSPNENIKGNVIYLTTERGYFNNFNSSSPITSKGLYYWYKLNGSWYAKSIIHNHNGGFTEASLAIDELYVIGAKETDELYIPNMQVDYSTGKLQIAIYKNGSSVAQYWHTTDGEFNKVIKFTTMNNSGITVYAVINTSQTFAKSGMSYANSPVGSASFDISKNPQINQYLFDHSGDDIKDYIKTIGYTFGGIVTPTDSPSVSFDNAVYIGKTKGIYSNFGSSCTVPDEDSMIIIYKHTNGSYYSWALKDTKKTNSKAVWAIKELYVQGATLDDKLYITSGAITVDNNKINIAVYKNGVAVASYWHTTDGEFNKVVKFNTTDGSDTVIYAVFDEYDVDAFSGVGYENGKFTQYAFSLKGNRMIEQYLLENIQDDINTINNELHPTSAKWTATTALNNIIDEFYIPDAATRYPDGLFMTAVDYEPDKANGIRFWSINNDGSYAFQVEVSLHKYHYSDEADGSADIYFDSNSITPIYSYVSNGVPERIGYIKFNKNYKYANSGAKIAVDRDIISNIDNSPTIKKMLADDRQIVLMGDSHYGYPLPSTLVDIIQGITGIKTFNLGFGGCRMAWRSSDGTDNYDVFTFPNLAQAMTTGDYSSQIAQAGLGSMSYYKQVRDLQDVDITKPFQIILHFGANDCTGGNELGNLFNPPDGFDFTDETQRTSYLATLDRTKYNEAFIYGLITFYNTCPTNFTIQAMNEGWRWYNDANSKNINPYDYKNTAGLGVQDYMDGLKNNCHRMGIRYLDYANSGIMNAFSLRTTDTDHITGVGILGSAHLEAIGISMVALYIAKNVKNFYIY